MYKVIKIIDSQATRDIELKNQATGTVDLCFADSALVSIDNFEFMEEGEKYNCKIELFGKVIEDRTPQSILCKAINEDVMIGNCHSVSYTHLIRTKMIVLIFLSTFVHSVSF